MAQATRPSEIPEVGVESHPSKVLRARLQVAQVLAFVALLAALVGALGPADQTRTTYSWPPPTLPAGAPSRAWYTPLLLIRHRPEALSATVPCSLPPALAAAERPLTVLATARSPERIGGFAVRRTDGGLVVKVGDRVLRRVPLPAGPASGGTDCAYRVELGGGRWSLEGGPGEVTLAGSLGGMPVVSGLFSALDLRSDTHPSIDVTTAVHATHPGLRQTVAWTLAILCVVGALLLAALEARPEPWRAVRRAGKAAVAHAQPADAAVAIVLVGWCVLAPAFDDDGWVIARERMFSSSGGFSAYYNSFGANYPNGYWLEWAQHWLSNSSLLALRLPALFCLAAVWALCRWIVARVLASSSAESPLALWALTSAFLAGALAWGMTVRPEPVSALFVTAVLACTVRFVEKGTAAPLAAIAVLLPLGLTGHHSALVSFAPLVVIAPTLFRWARSRVAVASTLAASALALLAVLLFVGADLEQRRSDALIAPEFQESADWRDEILRYKHLLDFPEGTPLRRASVALIALALFAFLLRRARVKRPLLDLPAASLGVALVLLIAMPTRHSWHFGALAGMTAVAVAAETTRVRIEAASSRDRALWPLMAIGAAVMAIAWSWYPRHAWNVVDLRTLDWTPGFERSLPLSTLAIGLPVLLLAGAWLLAFVRGRRKHISMIPWRVASWTAPALAVPLIVFTLGVLVVDTAKTDSWTLARQNLGALAGGVGCGLADNLLVPVTDSARALPIAGAVAPPPVPTWVPAAPVAGLPRFALGPAGEVSAARSPWFRLPAQTQVGIFVAGVPGPLDRLALAWGHDDGGRIRSLETNAVSTSFVSEAGAVLPWRFVAGSELPARERGANAVRVTLRSGVGPGATVAVTAPLTYVREPLSRRLHRGLSPSLVLPSLVPYFPCARLPRLSDGIVEPPDEILVPRDSDSPVRFAGSPFAGVLDLYRLERLPIADSENPPGGFLVLGVNQQIPGAAYAAPDRETPEKRRP